MLEQIATILWGPFTLIILLGTGLYCTVSTGFLPITKLKTAFALVLKDESDAKGQISGWGALCASLAATLGTGNIIGVATALQAGGPGALFWMLVSSLLGMATKYTECFLAVRYRKPWQGGFLGGPFLYLEKGVRSPLLAKIFAASCALSCIISMGTTSQIRGMVDALCAFFDPRGALPPFRLGPLSLSPLALLAGAIITFLAARVLKGGIEKISSLSTHLVPLMAGIYTGLILLVILQNVSKIPAATLLILRSAFAPKAVLGGAAGYTFSSALRYGLGRGIFSNEAGMGSDAITAASARTQSPYRQGLISMLGPFLDTVVMCTLTGYGILLSGVFESSSLDGQSLTLKALLTLPLPPRLIAFLYMICLLFFGFSSIIGWSYYGEQSLCYLFPRRPHSRRLFRAAFLVFLFCGAHFSSRSVWALADIFCALMVFPNLIGVLFLSKEVFAKTK